MVTYVSALGRGNSMACQRDDDIVIAIHGPKGGSRAIEQVSAEEAAQLGAKLNPAMLSLLKRVAMVIDMTDPEHEDFADSGADTVQALCELEADLRAAIAKAEPQA